MARLPKWGKEVQEQVEFLEDFRDKTLLDLTEVKSDLGQVKTSVEGVKNDLEQVKVSVKKTEDELSQVKVSVEGVKTDLSQVKVSVEKVKDDVGQIKTSVEKVKESVDMLKWVFGVTAAAVLGVLIFSFTTHNRVAKFDKKLEVSQERTSGELKRLDASQERTNSELKSLRDSIKDLTAAVSKQQPQDAKALRDIANDIKDAAKLIKEATQELSRPRSLSPKELTLMVRLTIGNLVKDGMAFRSKQQPLPAEITADKVTGINARVSAGNKDLPTINFLVTAQLQGKNYVVTVSPATEDMGLIIFFSSKRELVVDVTFAVAP